jgi:hypothetical protein
MKHGVPSVRQERLAIIQGALAQPKLDVGVAPVFRTHGLQGGALQHVHANLSDVTV